MFLANFGKSSTEKAVVIYLPRANKFLLFTGEHFKMVASSILILTLTVLSSLTLVKEESSRDGIKGLPPWKKDKKLLSFVHQILHTEREDLLREFLPTPLFILKLSFWISKTKSKKNGKWVSKKNWPKLKMLKIKEIRLLKREITLLQLASTQKESVLSRTMNPKTWKKSWKF